ncbi:hypothetical protein DFH08DRAFT_959902 [Mycena albidolilacea]|uniref:Uncharacterized protein n=1 Tax=Mycena albidolilacea TaxID=1033008 RepID=A0AAD7A2Z7_9AGAR|nr:hypothetical protein DFH08DRAFT_959902 [Mycena albidolilacea]
MTDVDIVPPEPTGSYKLITRGSHSTNNFLKCTIGKKYPPSKLSDHRGPYFTHNKPELVQRDYTDKDGKLIAPKELYATLTKGTLVLVVVPLATYVTKDQKTESGTLFPDKKVCATAS